jgi:hypothetical protein
MMFIQKNIGFIQKILITFEKTCVFPKCLISHFFHQKNQPNTFSERFSHANVNEFDDWRAPSHCKTFGLFFRKWIGMGRPK